MMLKKRSVIRESTGQSRRPSSPMASFVAQKKATEPSDTLSHGFQRPVQERVDVSVTRISKETSLQASVAFLTQSTGQHLLDRLTGKTGGDPGRSLYRASKDERSSVVAGECLNVGANSHSATPAFAYAQETSLIESKAQLKNQKNRESKPREGESGLLPAIEDEANDNDRRDAASWVKGHGWMTNNGCVRQYNEDCITAIPDVQRPERIAEGLWPRCSFFAVYDGHGGETCSQFLMNHLHDFVFQSNHFPHNPKMALLQGFEVAEQTFVEQALRNAEDIDYSGSCALVVLVVNDLCYIANLGDSRLVGSYFAGKKVKQLSTDMKPCDKAEQLRVTLAGGKVYQSTFQQINPITRSPFTAYGPLRVFPGRLNVCRSVGDVEAKEPRLGGKPGVIIAVPDVKVFKITSELDYIVLASDGVYDRLENEEVIGGCWKGVQRAISSGDRDIDAICKSGVEEVMRLSLLNKTQDNISAIMVSFKSPHHLQSTVTKQDMQKSFHERLCNMLKKSKPLPKSAPQEALINRRRLTPFESSLLNGSFK